MMKKFLYLTIVCFLSFISIHAQGISGRIVNEAGQPLEFVNIVVLRTADSTFVQGTTSRNDGSFTLAKPEVPSFMKISYIGYLTKMLPIKGDMGEIRLEENTATLNEVVVKSNRKLFDMGKEGVVTHVAGTRLSNIGTAGDILKYIPGITTNKDEINVFGKGKPLVYINGRQVYNLAELERLNSSEIKSIELIQNPGAQYDATAKAVLKIRTLRATGEGFGVSLRSSYWQSENTDITEQANLTYNKEKLYAFGTYKFSNINNHQKSTIAQQVATDKLWRQTNTFEQNSTKTEHEVSLGVNYDFNDKHSAGIKYIYDFVPGFTLKSTSATLVTADEALYDKLFTTNRAKDDNAPSHNLNVYYTGQFKDTNIDLNMDYLSNNSTNEQWSSEKSDKYNSEIASKSMIRSNMLAAKLAVSHKLFGGELRLGAEAVSSNRHDTYAINGTGLVDDVYSRLHESQFNPFAEYERPFSFANVHVGVRYEHVTFKYYLNDIYQTAQSRTFDNLFPYLSVGTKPGKVMFNMSYSVKTKRPTYRQLSGNVMYINRFSLQAGNPMLRNEHIHDLSLQGMWKFLQFTVSFQDNRNAIIFWDEAIPNNSSTIKLQYKNLSSLPSISSMLAIAPSFAIWEPQLVLGIRKQWLTLDTYGGSKHLGKPMFQVGFNNSISLPLGIDANVDFSFQSKGDYQNVSINKNTCILDVSFSKSFFNKALDIKISGTDLLHQKKEANIMYSDRIHIMQQNVFDSREFGLTLRYHFNAAKSKYKGTGAGNEEKNRL